jgi:D-arabinose 1-dehydrogenase-like Zn-dependent alcohol dehydrogenase
MARAGMLFLSTRTNSPIQTHQEGEGVMKAAVVESPGRLVVRDIPEPSVGEYDVLCQMLYGSTCSSTDQHLIEDKMPWRVQFPIVLGHESIGRAIRVGPKVRAFKVGDLISRVGTPPVPDIGLNVSWGGFCELGIAKDHRAMREDGVPDDRWRSYRINQVIPPSYDPAACTMIITWRETLSYARRLGVDRGSRVVVIGSGGTGLAFVVHARNLGASAITCVGNPSRKDVANRVGATKFFDYKRADLFEALEAESCECDVIIDSVGKVGMINFVLPLLRPNGMVGIYGLDDHDAMQINPFQARGTFTVYGGEYDEEEAHDEVIRRMADGSLNASDWLDLGHPFDLRDISQAIEAVRARKVIKALVRLGGE